MENNKKLFAIVVSIVVALSAYAQTTPLPYECTFENPADPAGWSFYRKNGKGVPQFVIGSAVHRIGAHSLYVSPDTGRTAGYESTTGGYIVTAARKFDFKAGDYNIRFDYHIVGDTKDDNDVMFVAFFPAIDTDGNPVVPVSTSNGSVVPDQIKDNIFADLRGRRVFASSGWTTVEGALVVPDDGEYWLAFYFRERGGKNTNYNPGVHRQCLCRYHPLVNRLYDSAHSILCRKDRRRCRNEVERQRTTIRVAILLIRITVRYGIHRYQGYHRQLILYSYCRFCRRMLHLSGSLRLSRR